jgi:hypothetical protein
MRKFADESNPSVFTKFLNGWFCVFVLAVLVQNWKKWFIFRQSRKMNHIPTLVRAKLAGEARKRF